ncbi:MAG: hypothetical protein ABI317_11410 [Gaiellales bacterium]
MRLRRLGAPLALFAFALALAGCGSSGSGTPLVPTVAPARTFKLGDFEPGASVAPHHAITVSFHIVLPSGQTLTHFRTGPGPHTGVHLILVRNDLSVIVHKHPKIAPDGTVRQSVVLPEPGRYHVLVDVYPIIPATPQLVNFQMTTSLLARGHATNVPLPPYSPSVTVRGYHVKILKTPRISALTPAFVTIRIRNPQGTSPQLEPWFGALAHAIFFRVGSLAYFHTHICAPSAPGCSSLVGGKALTGRGTSNGLLHVGILLPQSGTWRLFLQFQVDHHILTAPFTLQAH